MSMIVTDSLSKRELRKLEQEAVEKIELNGYTAFIVMDNYPFEPWEGYGTDKADSISQVAHVHDRYDIGGFPKNIGSYRGEYYWVSPQDFVRWAKKERAIWLPLAMFEHGSSMLYISDSEHPMDPGGWDSGQIGFIYTTPERLRKRWEVKRITKAVRKRAIEALKSETQTMDDYNNGNVYGYRIFDNKGNEVDACWGFYPDYVPRYLGMDVLRGPNTDGLDYIRGEIKYAIEGMDPIEPDTSGSEDEDDEEDDE